MDQIAKTANSENEPYEWSDIPICGSAIESLTPQILVEKPGILRRDLVEELRSRHIAHGGIQGSVDPMGVIKKTLKKMKDEGVLDSRGKGHYFLREDYDPELAAKLKVFAELARQEADEDQRVETQRIEVEQSYGTGKNSVYCYFYPGYLRSEQDFPCKIGKTSGRVTTRIFGQVTSAMPELPIVAWVINTNDESTLEKYLHAALTLRNKWKEDALGIEWFTTTPKEALQLVRDVNPELLI